MKEKNIRFVLLLIIFVIVIFYIACKPSPKRTTLTIYTSIPAEIIDSIKERFESKYPSIELAVFRKGTTVIQDQVKAELNSGGIRGDVIWVANPLYYIDLKNKGLLYPYKSKFDEDIPDILKDSEHYFYAGRMISMVLAYNSSIVDSAEVPQKWIDFADEKWQGQTVMGNALYSGTLELGVTILANRYGWEYFEQLNEHNMAIVKSNSGAAQKIVMGEFPLGVTLDYTVRVLKEKGEPIELIYPEDGIIVLPSPIAIFATSQHKKEAQLFLDYILSREGQTMLVEKGFFIPIREDVSLPSGTGKIVNLSDVLDKAIPEAWDVNSIGTEDTRSNFSRIFLEQK